MIHSFQQYDYNYQRPSKQMVIKKCQSLTDRSHTEQERQDSLPAAGGSFYNDPKLLTAQSENIKKLMLAIDNQKIQLPIHWTHGDSLRFLFYSKSDIKKTTKTIEEHIEKMKEISKFVLVHEAINYLRNGFIYIAGRSKLDYPIFVISMKDLVIDHKTIPFIQDALLFCIMTLKKYMMLGGICETYDIFIDLNGLNPIRTHLPFLKKLLHGATTNFSHPGGKTIVYNPSMGFNVSWNLLKTFIPEMNIKDTIFIKKGEEKKLWEFFEPKLWEKRFGGQMNDYLPGRYWPPKEFINRSNVISKKAILKQKQHIFWIFDKNIDSAIWTFEQDKYERKIDVKLWEQRSIEHDQLITKYNLTRKMETNHNTKDISDRYAQKQLDQLKNKVTTVRWYHTIFGFCCSAKTYKVELLKEESIETSLNSNKDANLQDCDIPKIDKLLDVSNADSNFDENLNDSRDERMFSYDFNSCHIRGTIDKLSNGNNDNNDVSHNIDDDIGVYDNDYPVTTTKNSRKNEQKSIMKKSNYRNKNWEW